MHKVHTQKQNKAQMMTVMRARLPILWFWLDTLGCNTRTPCLLFHVFACLSVDRSDGRLEMGKCTCFLKACVTFKEDVESECMHANTDKKNKIKTIKMQANEPFSALFWSDQPKLSIEQRKNGSVEKKLVPNCTRKPIVTWILLIGYLLFKRTKS